MEVLRTIRPNYSYVYAMSSPIYAHASSRFLLARALEELGRLEEATGAYRSLQAFHDAAAAYAPIAELGLGRVAERRGDRVRAARQYSRFVELWADADPELQGVVHDAKAALSRLTRESE